MRRDESNVRARESESEKLGNEGGREKDDEGGKRGHEKRKTCCRSRRKAASKPEKALRWREIASFLIQEWRQVGTGRAEEGNESGERQETKEGAH